MRVAMGGWAAQKNKALKNQGYITTAGGAVSLVCLTPLPCQLGNLQRI
jgi:hypothetical protein